MARTSNRTILRNFDNKSTYGSSTDKGASTCTETETFIQARINFQNEVVNSIAKLENIDGLDKREAVLILLERIAGNFPTPSAGQITEMVTKYGIDKEDAFRALVVRDELQRLRRSGLDTLAALREITTRLQQQAPSEISRIPTAHFSISEVPRRNKRNLLNSSSHIPKQSASVGLPSELSVVVEESPVSNVFKRLKMYSTVGIINNDTSGCSIQEKSDIQIGKIEKKKEKGGFVLLPRALSTSSTHNKQRAASLDSGEPLKRVRKKK